MSRFGLQETALAGLRVVRRQRVEDERGYFSRFFCAQELAAAGFVLPIAQINHTYTTRRGSVRGLHYQGPPHSEDKFISCLRGEIFDVAVDLRRDSPTFLRWHGEVLSATNATSLLVPQGFAHGFQTLSDDCELIYLHSRPYAAGAEAGLNVRDPKLAINWPLPFGDISARDAAHPLITRGFIGLST
ncbi:MAG TPA: dTDP-4-dehydrorhamnose 3,5-epimerase family protein [Steroidobacteraceae bacterium]